MGITITVGTADFSAANIIGKIQFPHKYFRIEVLATGNNTNLGIGEIKLSETSGGANLASGRPITVTPDNNPNSDPNAMLNGNVEDYWGPVNSATAAIVIDLGVPRNIQQVQIALPSGLPSSWGPTSLRFSTSDDGQNFTTAWSATTAANYAGGNFKSFLHP